MVKELIRFLSMRLVSAIRARAMRTGESMPTGVCERRQNAASIPHNHLENAFSARPAWNDRDSLSLIDAVRACPDDDNPHRPRLLLVVDNPSNSNPGPTRRKSAGRPGHNASRPGHHRDGFVRQGERSHPAPRPRLLALVGSQPPGG